MEIKIIPLGSDDKPLDSYGQDGKSFAETYAPIVELLLRESRLHAVGDAPGRVPSHRRGPEAAGGRC